jgi:hypothetical protein
MSIVFQQKGLFHQTVKQPKYRAIGPIRHCHRITIANYQTRRMDALPARPLIQINGADIEPLFQRPEPASIIESARLVLFVAVSIKGDTPAIQTEIAQTAKVRRRMPEPVNIFLPRLAEVSRGMFFTGIRFCISVNIAKATLELDIDTGIFPGVMRCRVGQYPLANQGLFFLGNLSSPR